MVAGRLSSEYQGPSAHKGVNKLWELIKDTTHSVCCICGWYSLDVILTHRQSATRCQFPGCVFLFPIFSPELSQTQVSSQPPTHQWASCASPPAELPRPDQANSCLPCQINRIEAAPTLASASRSLNLPPHMVTFVRQTSVFLLTPAPSIGGPANIHQWFQASQLASKGL